MWVIIKTSRGKTFYLAADGEWSQTARDAEPFLSFTAALYHRDSNLALLDRRGVGVIKVDR